MSIRLKSAGGFTLIELTIMIVVVGILASIAMQSMTSVVDDARLIQTEREMQLIADAIVGDVDKTSDGIRSDFGYVGDVGSFPTSIDDLLQNPGGYATWGGPYLADLISEDTSGPKTDEWGQTYNYSGGTAVTSTGSGSTITKPIARATADYLLNSLNGLVTDRDNNSPGTVYNDSIDITITIPNGSGGLTTKNYQPDSAGLFLLDSLPVGDHSINVIYAPNVDTLRRFVTILPRHKSSVSYKFSQAYFAGGGSGSSSEILRPEGTGLSADLILSGCPQNWECVDESSSDDDATNVGGSGNSYLTDIYSMQDHSTGSGTIDSVVVYAHCKGGGSGQQIKTVLRTNGTTHEGAMENLTTVTVYTSYSTSYVTNPTTSTAWIWTEIDDLEAGVSIRRAGFCTQVWVEVFYTN